MTRLKYLTAIALFSLAAIAYGDSNTPPVFVVADGQDTGNCQSVTMPCRSLQYALQKVGKNGKIRVGIGRYELSDIADTIYLLSGAIDVQASSNDGPRPTLVGAPAEFAAALEAKGFRVLIDSKGLHQASVQTQQSVMSNSAATACVGGLAASFPCSSVNLLAHVADRTPDARGADIWGFMDLNTQREYAIIGYSSGTAVFDVTDAENPREVGFVDGQSTTWRDIKVHQFWNATQARWNAYAYVTTDGASDGLFIVDLNQLPHSIARVNYNSDFSEAHNVYLTNTEFSTGVAITDETPTLVIAGSNIGDGRYRNYSLSNPAAPSFTATPVTPANQPGDDRLYMHDAASMLVTDTRKDTQCVNANSSDACDVLFDFNESSMDIWDVTNPASPQRLSRLPYDNSSYTHSGWATEDQQFLFIQDELDERDNGLSTTLRVVSIADLSAPILVGSWTGPTRAIDHNGFVRGNRYYMSNYSRGLTVLDITDPANASIAGRFDTYPAADGVGFPGNWGVYPFLPSGNIALSDIDSGFYLVADDTLNVEQGTLSFSATSYGAVEGQAAELSVARSGGTQGAATVRWEVIRAEASLTDVALNSGTLTWANGDSDNRTFSIPIVDDGETEGQERLLVRLYSPTGGATISAPGIVSAYIADPNDGATAQFLDTSISISERGSGFAIATVQRSGNPTGSLSVDFSIAGGDASSGTDFAGPTSGTLSWANGDANPKSIEYSVSNDANAETDEFFDIQLSNAVAGSIGTNDILRVNILDGSGSNSAPNSIAGSGQTVAGGTSVSLNGSSSNDPDGDSLTYAWSQTQGSAVTLSNANAAQASFTAPTVTSSTLLQFQLTVSDGAGLSDNSTVNVTVSAGTSAGGGSSSGGGILDWFVLLVLCAAVLRALLRERVRLDNRLLPIRTRRNNIDRNAR